MADVIKNEKQKKTSQENAAEVNRVYGGDGDPNDPYDRDYTAQSAKGYTPTDTTTVNNSMYYAKEENMKGADKASLVQAGVDYNAAKERGDQAAMDAAHALAEEIRGKYGYSGGADGSEYIKTEQKDNVPSSGGGSSGGTAGDRVNKLTNRAPDLTGLMDSWLSSAKQQQEHKIDYATQQGVTQLQRAEEDAQAKFQTQQNQVDTNEAKALDNQALYAEARGDRGGIGQAQYAQIQATAMQNRRTINSARTKLATDTARQIADLRAQGEFQKADALLELTQTYLSQLIELEQWGAEFNLDVDKFNSQIERWQAEFDKSLGDMLGEYQGIPTLENQKFQTSVNQWNQEYAYNVQQNQREFLANSGLAALSVGIRPSAAQQAAMGYTDQQIAAELAAYSLAQKSAGKGGASSKSSSKTSSKTAGSQQPATLAALLEDMFLEGITDELSAKFYLRQLGYTSGDSEDYAQAFAAKYGPDYLNNSENRNGLYQQLGGKAKEVLSTIERSNARNGTSGLSKGDQSKLLLAVEEGSVTERDLAIIRKLLGY